MAAKKKTTKKTAGKKKTAKKTASKKAPAKKTGHRYQPGNRWWEARSSHGRKPIFSGPEQLWEACQEYFQWVEDNPLQQSEVVKYQGKATLAKVPKMRAMTIGGLCIFLDIDRSTWLDYAKKPDFSEIATRVEEVIRKQKFEGAAADLLNPNIIARELGLKDSQEHSGPNNGPIEHKIDHLSGVQFSRIMDKVEQAIDEERSDD